MTIYSTRISYFSKNPCFLCRRFIWNFLRVENEHLSRLKGVVDQSDEELREYDEDTDSQQTDEWSRGHWLIIRGILTGLQPSPVNKRTKWQSPHWGAMWQTDWKNVEALKFHDQCLWWVFFNLKEMTMVGWDKIDVNKYMRLVFKFNINREYWEIWNNYD